VTAVQAGIAVRSDEEILSIEVRRDGVAVVMLDDTRAAENTVTVAFEAQLLATIARIDEDASIAAAVLTSGKPSGFVAGLSTGLLTSIKFATDAERMSTELAQALRKLESLRKPVVAAVHGPALGAGFELALACHAIVASDDPATVLGFPEAHLGLVPAANGSIRASVRAGLRAAIDLVMRGEPLRASAARELDLVDDVCPRAILLDAAARYAKALVGHVPRVRDERGDLRSLVLEKNPVGRGFLFKRAREAVKAAGGPQGPAAATAIDVLERFAEKGLEEASRAEAKAFGDLVVSETAHRLIELSIATTALARDPGVDEKAEPRRVRRIGVIGGGVMGGGIAYAAVSSGIGVRLKERDDAAIGRSLRGVKTLLDEGVGRGALSPLDAEQIAARLSTTTDYSGLRNADAVVEAVPEDLALKQEVLREIEALVDAKCVFASNTASIPIAKIAQAAQVPERVLGMHYFNPAHATSLLEVVRADKTAPWAVATAVAIGKRQRKTVIVVKDGPGFYTTRILFPFLLEAVQLVSDGLPAPAVDEALVEWGFATGPLAQVDDRGIDTVLQVAQGLQATLGTRMTPPGALAALVADERRGRKNGRGIYRYAPGGQPLTRDGRRVLDSGAYALLGVEPRTRLPVDEIQQRCVLAMVNEAVRCLGDGILRSPRDGDVGAIFGLGFPRFRGGPFRYVDTIGAADVLRRVQSYADRFGDRWRPAPLLVQMAKKGERFFG
jgi:3-hydroxyacyl-CoA dehydrogenase/enoyl-CoA hydratase/3-hydroxybutyryl-CoA epimerase